MLNVINEDREYQRILPSDASIKKLDKLGYEWVYSSNVSAATTRGNDLIIRFHNSSLYSYKGQAKSYENLMAAASKGKWVWRFLRRPGVPYKKIGSLPLPEDIDVSDEDIIREIPKPKYSVKSILPSNEQVKKGMLPSIMITPLDQAKSIVDSSGSFTPITGGSGLFSVAALLTQTNGIIGAVMAASLIKGT